MSAILALGCALLGVATLHADFQASFQISSPDFPNHGQIPDVYACKGADYNRSPKFVWSGAPTQTKSFALICNDPDAPSGNFIHWVVYNIPGTTTQLKEGIGKVKHLPDGTVQGINSFRRIGYDGPCPPPGKPHRYIFTLYALDALLEGIDMNSQDVEEAMKGHILKQTQWTGLYTGVKQ